MKRSIIGFTFSIIAAVTYLIAVIMMVTVVDTHAGGGDVYMGEAVVAVSVTSVVMALIGLFNGIKAKNGVSSLKIASIITSIIVAVVGAGTAIIMALECWG